MERHHCFLEQTVHEWTRHEDLPTMRIVPIESRHRNVGAYERCIKQRVKQVQGRAFSYDVINSVDRPAVVRAPVDTSDVAFSTDDNSRTCDKRLFVPTDDSA